MTSIALEALDLVSLVANIRDQEALRLVSRVVQAHTTVLEAQLSQFKQLNQALQQRAQATAGSARKARKAK